MKQLIAVIAIFTTILFSGCATTSYSQTGDVVYTQDGIIERVIDTTIKDNGSGMLLGAVVGGLAGNQIGKGRGNTVATVGGAVAGGAVGNQMNKKEGQELSIRMENGQLIHTIVKDKYYRTGDLVTVEFKNNRINSITLFNY